MMHSSYRGQEGEAHPDSVASNASIRNKRQAGDHDQSGFLPRQEQYQHSDYAGIGNGAGIAQGSWSAQMQHVQSQSLPRQFEQMNIISPGFTSTSNSYHPSTAPQYAGNQYAPVQYQYQTNRIGTYPPHSSYYNGPGGSHLYDVNTLGQGPANSVESTIRANAFNTMPYNKQASAYTASTSRQSLQSPRQQFTDTLRRGVQDFTYQPTSSLPNAGPLLKSPIDSQGPSFLPARPDSAIKASQAMENEVRRIANETNLASSRLSGKHIPQPQHQSGPSRSAPTISLHTRFPPLPPKPGDEASVEDFREAFVKREEALMLRVEAVGFQPEMAWRIFSNHVEESALKDDLTNEDEHNREAAAPILGIRLLQKLDQLQKENEELFVLFNSKMKTKSSIQERQDTTRLLQALDTALTDAKKRAEVAEEKVTQLEKALAVACEQQSKSIVSKERQ